MYNTCIMYYYSIQNVWKVPFLCTHATIIQSFGIVCRAAFFLLNICKRKRTRRAYTRTHARERRAACVVWHLVTLSDM